MEPRLREVRCSTQSHTADEWKSQVHCIALYWHLKDVLQVPLRLQKRRLGTELTQCTRPLLTTMLQQDVFTYMLLLSKISLEIYMTHTEKRRQKLRFMRGGSISEIVKRDWTLESETFVFKDQFKYSLAKQSWASDLSSLTYTIPMYNKEEQPLDSGIVL